MQSIIQIEGLAKKYRINGPATRGRYSTLREAIGQKLRAGLRGIFDQKQEATDFWALQDVSLTVNRGDVVGIVGRNGAGKSTLLKVLSRITEPTDGRVILRGRVASLLEVGTGFHPELTGRENIYLNGAILGMRKREIRRIFDQIVSFAEVDKFIDTPVKRYSSGMYVRLAFSVAAHLEPEILVIDEVLAVGDLSFQRKCLGKMHEVATGGRTILFVSHSPAAVMSLCTRAICLEKGRKKTDGSVEEALAQYSLAQADERPTRSWPTDQRPGDDLVRLCRVSVRQSDDNAIAIDKVINVDVDYDVIAEGISVATSVHLNTSLGTCVFASTNFPSVSATVDPYGYRPHSKGTYRATLQIPENFLNDGNYCISVFLLTDGGALRVAEREVVHFTAQDSPVMRAEYNGPWVGVVRTKLPWNTERV